MSGRLRGRVRDIGTGGHLDVSFDHDFSDEEMRDELARVGRQIPEVNHHALAHAMAVLVRSPAGV